jgi:hypothetical protein
MSHALNEGGKSMIEPDPDETDRRRFNAVRQTTRTHEPNFSKKGKGAPPPPLNPTGAAHWNYGRTLKRGWAGSYGPAGDPRSKLAKLIRRIEEEELIPLYGRPAELGAQTLLREVATWRGMARAMLNEIGLSKDASVRKAAGMSRMASSKEAELRTLMGKVKPWEPTRGADLIRLRAEMKHKEKTHD